MSVQPSTNVPAWMHTETDPQAGVDLAFRLAGGPAAVAAMDTTTRIHALRCLAALSIYACQAVQGPKAVSPTMPVATGAEGQQQMTLLGSLYGSLYPSREALYVASTLGRTMILIPDRGPRQVYSTVTTDGQDATTGGQGVEDTGLPPLLLAGVIIAGVVACCIATVHIAGTVCNAVNIDRKLERETDTARMIAAQAKALQLVSDHTERERVAGKSLPWDPVGELRAIDALNGIQHEIVSRERSSWPTPFPGAIGALGAAGAQIAGNLTTVALMLGGAFILTRG